MNRRGHLRRWLDGIVELVAPLTEIHGERIFDPDAIPPAGVFKVVKPPLIGPDGFCGLWLRKVKIERKTK